MPEITGGSFDQWNEIKKRIDASEPKADRFPKMGEVWMSALGKNIGYEQNGAGDNFSRPVLVVHKFNNKMFFVVPLSTKQKSFDFYYNCTDPDGNKISLILAQLRLLSIKRLERKLYAFDSAGMSKIRTRLAKFFQ